MLLKGAIVNGRVKRAFDKAWREARAVI